MCQPCSSKQEELERELATAQANERATAVLLTRAEERIADLVEELTISRGANQSLRAEREQLMLQVGELTARKKPALMPCPRCGVKPLCFMEADGVKHCVACGAEVKL